MSEKPKERDILADILNDPHTGTIRGLEELNKLIHAAPGETSAKATPKSARPRKKGRKGGKKQKTTHYLTREVFDNLGEAKEGIRDLLPEESKSWASKSRIVESAITVVLHEFGEKGKESALVRELLKKHKDT